MNNGAGFRSIRESRGLSLEAVAARTRIPLRMIEALEGNDLHTLPARPYARGFVTAYARELGLNATEVVPEYFSQFESSPPSEPSSPPGGDRRRGTAVNATAMAVALLAVALAVAAVRWWPGMVSWWRSTVPAAPAAGATAAPATNAPPAAVATPETRTAATVGLTAPAAPRPAGELVVSLTFEQRCWIAASVDGTRVLFQTMEAGATQTLTARRQIVIRVGNAGVATWSVNGRPPAPLGRMGEVRTVTLTADGPAGS